MNLHQAFCPQCGVGLGFDDEQCCTSCGAMVCSIGDVQKLLGAAGIGLVEIGAEEMNQIAVLYAKYPVSSLGIPDLRYERECLMRAAQGPGLSDCETQRFVEVNCELGKRGEQVL